MIRKLKVSGAPILGVLTSLLTGIAGIAIVARLLLAGYMGDNTAGWIVKLFLLISALLGSMVGCLGMKEKQYRPLVIAVSYFGALIICGLLLFEGGIQDVPVTMAAIMGGGTVAYVIRQKGRGKRRKRK